MAHSFKDHNKVPKSYIDSAKNVLNGPLYGQLPNEDAKLENITRLLGDYVVDQRERDYLLKLYQDAKGKVVYLGFGSPTVISV